MPLLPQLNSKEKINLFILFFLVLQWGNMSVGRAAVLEEDKSQTSKIVVSKFFDKQMMFNDDLYVLHDVLEFSVFDISEVEIKNDSGEAEVKVSSLDADGNPKDQVVAAFSGKVEIENALPEIPKYFYKSLKSEILRKTVPVTLYPKDAPGYSKPLKLAIKLKKIQLLPVRLNGDGNYVQPVQMRIYGQIKDKKSDEVLTRFYDSDSTEFVLGSDPTVLSQALNKMSEHMMQDFAMFLKSQY